MYSPKTLTTLEAGALRAALRKLLQDDQYFSISTFDQMLQVYGGSITDRDHAALRLLHCVYWREMDAPTKQAAHDVIFQCFAVPGTEVAAFALIPDPAPAPRVPLLKRLLG